MDFSDMIYEITNIENTMFINHIHQFGFRQSVYIRHKTTYTFEDMLNIINMIDKAWENNTNKDNNDDEMDTTYIQ
jgi:hypothetical protein